MDQSDFDLNFQNRSVESKIVAALERIAQAFRVLLWQESKEFGLSPIQVQVLIFLLFQPRTRKKVSYLAEEFNMTKATISDAVKSLEQKELIRKDTEPQDTRSYTIHLTTKGKRVAEKASLFSKSLREPIDQLDTQAKEQLLSSMLNIIAQLNSSGIITVQRMCSTCAYYQSDTDGTHFCRLLNKALKPVELRIDCPDHESVK